MLSVSSETWSGFSGHGDGSGDAGALGQPARTPDGRKAMRNPALFEQHPATSQSHLIQFHPWMGEYLLATGYAEAARRLAASYSAEPWDDVILLPYMFLWRQAIELVLKDAIRRLAGWRREIIVDGYDLDAAEVNDLLKSEVGHRISRLRMEVRSHLDALGRPQLPQKIERTLQILEAVDNRGTTFRYAGVLKSPGADINFESLHKQLDDAFGICSVIVDAATDGEG